MHFLSEIAEKITQNWIFMAKEKVQRNSINKNYKKLGKPHSARYFLLDSSWIFVQLINLSLNIFWFHGPQINSPIRGSSSPPRSVLTVSSSDPPLDILYKLLLF
jgi:hypothetical protein